MEEVKRLVRARVCNKMLPNFSDITPATFTLSSNGFHPLNNCNKMVPVGNRRVISGIFKHYSLHLVFASNPLLTQMKDLSRQNHVHVFLRIELVGVPANLKPSSLYPPLNIKREIIFGRFL